MNEWVLPVPPKRVRRGWLIALAVVAALVVVFIVAAVIVAVAVSRAADRDIERAGQTCRGFVYEAREDRDHCAGMGDSVRDFGQTVTVKGLRHVAPSGADPAHVCADVSYVNRDDESKYFSEYDWRLGDSDGTVHDSDAEASSLGEGEMAAEGRTSGAVCFEDTGERGTVTVIWAPDESRGDRGVWLGVL